MTTPTALKRRIDTPISQEVIERMFRILNDIPLRMKPQHLVSSDDIRQEAIIKALARIQDEYDDDGNVTDKSIKKVLEGCLADSKRTVVRAALDAPRDPLTDRVTAAPIPWDILMEAFGEDIHFGDEQIAMSQSPRHPDIPITLRDVWRQAQQDYDWFATLLTDITEVWEKSWKDYQKALLEWQASNHKRNRPTAPNAGRRGIDSVVMVYMREWLAQRPELTKNSRSYRTTNQQVKEYLLEWRDIMHEVANELVLGWQPHPTHQGSSKQKYPMRLTAPLPEGKEGMIVHKQLKNGKRKYVTTIYTNVAAGPKTGAF